MSDASARARDKQLGAVLQALRAHRDSEADWSRLYDLAWPYVFAIAYRELGAHRATAEDTAQEVFVRLVRFAPFDRLSTGAELRAYIGVMARNAARNVTRRVVLQQLGVEPVETSAPSPEGLAAARERVEQTLRPLSPEDRLLAELLACGASYAEIAESLGIKENAVAARIHRLRIRLHAARKSSGPA